MENLRNLKHGHCKGGISSTWETWHSMIQRCSNRNRKDYKYYGAKGVSVCKKWQTFEGFLEDMGTKPDGLSIDRIDSTGPYSKKNCQWADRAQQARNRSNTVWYTIKGETLCQADWCKKMGMNRSIFHQRLKRGWTPEKALFTPLR